MADMSGRLHFIWDHSDGLDEPWRCWCGVDHPDDNGLTGVAKYISRDDPGWVSITDPRAEAALDDLYAEAWLSPVPLEPPDPTLPPEAEGQPYEYGWWAVGAPPEPKT